VWLVLGINQSGFAQDFPGESDPIGGPNKQTGGSPERFTQLSDDELAFMSFSPAGSSGNVPL